jgi:alpha-D-ribose 1-methylphosphonate 5-triphosphate synthase subunit PhnI
MTEGGIYDPDNWRRWRSSRPAAIWSRRSFCCAPTVPRYRVWRSANALDTEKMRLERRISAVYKDLPGGQVLGPTYDYTHRLLDFALLAKAKCPP